MAESRSLDCDEDAFTSNDLSQNDSEESLPNRRRIILRNRTTTTMHAKSRTALINQEDYNRLRDQDRKIDTNIKRSSDENQPVEEEEEEGGGESHPDRFGEQEPEEDSPEGEGGGGEGYQDHHQQDEEGGFRGEEDEAEEEETEEGEAQYNVWMHRSVEEVGQIDDFPACIKEVLGYAESLNVCERQISCRHLVETLKDISESPDDVERLFKIIDKLSQDLEQCVIAELIDHVLPIARFCYDKEHLRYLIADRLVPLLLKFLMASDFQVRGNAQECLHILRLQNLIDQETVRRDICPVIINLTYATQSSPEYYANAITLMTKMAPMLGREATEEFFVPRIISLSMDSVMQVRKTCVANFGEFCSAVSTHITENVLLPYFIRSCYDNRWEVRKSCAEVIMSVSCACRLETRKSTLAPVCAALLSDSNRSVRMAAFETLGPFITTFAEPSITGLAYNQHGQLVLTNWSGFEFRTTPKDDERCRNYDEICSELNENDFSSLIVGLSDTSSSVSNDNSTTSGDSGVITSNIENSKLRDYEQNSNDNSIVVNNTSSFSSSQLSKQTGDSSNENSGRNKNENYLNNNNYTNSNNINTNFIENSNSNKTAIDDNEDSLLQYNAFLYWRDPLPVLDELDIPVKISDSSCSLNDSLLSSSSLSSPSSLSSVNDDDDDNVSKNIFSISDDKEKLKDSNVPSTSSSSLTSLNDNSNAGSSGSDVKKTQSFVSKGNGNKDDASPMVEMFVLQMYDRLYSEFNNDLTYKPIPVLPFSDPSTVRQNVSLFRVPGLGLCRKKPCEKPRQNIVPQELIDHFVSLSDPVQGNCVDNRFLVYQIAYSLPAVAQTLGKENWSLLKNVYEKLAADKTWKVRRAVASSIHELAAIVGQDNATQDLIPVFNNIIKDLDEVRIGALKHLASFLKTLRPAGRNSFLPKLSEFLITDCDMNWRFREELAEQLLQMVGLFSAADTYTHLIPLAVLLLLDRVAAVRQVALSLVTELVRWISSDVRLLHSILVEIAEQFAHSTRWNRRQTFALLCSKLVSQNVLPEETFAVNVLPHLLDLSWDLVPNVRLAVARTLSADIAHHSYFNDPQCPHHEVVMQTLRRLQADRDRDVQYLAYSKPRSVSPPLSDDGTAQEST